MEAKELRQGLVGDVKVGGGEADPLSLSCCKLARNVLKKIRQKFKNLWAILNHAFPSPPLTNKN